jgi:hypothetical protein
MTLIQCFATNYMDQIPSWDANTRPDGQEIPLLLWNPKDHYHAHKSLPLDPILSHINTVHALTFYFF